MQTDLQELVNISQFYGKDKRYVIAGGGNTSLKTADRIWIKASGFPLSTITEEGFSMMDREKLQKISTREYSKEPFQREQEIKDDLAEANLTKDRRPSVETSLHNLMDFKFVVHLHPALVNGLLCGNDAEKSVLELFGEDVLYVPYIIPGYVVFKDIEAMLAKYSEEKGKVPAILMLQNHGIFVGAESTAEIRQIYGEVFSTIEAKVTEDMPAGDIDIPEISSEILPALEEILSHDGNKTLKIRNSRLVEYFTGSDADFRKISKPFTPDIIVYCKSDYIYCNIENSAEGILADLKEKINSFESDFGYAPKVILIKGLGLIGIGENEAGAETILDIFEDFMKISWLSEFFGGQHFLSPEQISFIDTWEVESYRRKIAVKNV